MRLRDRIANIEDFVMLQKEYLKGREFQVKATSNDSFEITFTRIQQWQLNWIRNRLFELNWRHVKVTGKEILTTEPNPKKDDRRKNSKFRRRQRRTGEGKS